MSTGCTCSPDFPTRRCAACRGRPAGHGRGFARDGGRRGPPLDPACHDLRDFLARNHVSFDYYDIDDPAAAAFFPDFERRREHCPLVQIYAGPLLQNPTPRALAEALHIATIPKQPEYDVAIVGGGPAGLAAAVYGASEGLSTVLFEREAPGGQAGTSSRIENYLGFPTGLSGDDLAARAMRAVTC